MNPGNGKCRNDGSKRFIMPLDVAFNKSGPTYTSEGGMGGYKINMELIKNLCWETMQTM